MNNKNKKIIIISVIALFLVLGIGLTYAYFKSQIDNGNKKNVDVTSDTSDQLLFDVDNNIDLSINQFNFGPGAGDLVSKAKATASLRANSTKNTATYNYYVYFNIQDNKFIYTTPDEKTEILLQITDPTGNKVTEVEGLKYDSALEGFDITTASGLFEVAKSYEITSTSSTDATIQEWNFTAKFINLDSDQEANTGKSMNGIVVIQRIPKFNSLQDTCKTGNKLASCITTYAMDGIIDATTNKSSTNIYYHNGTIKNKDGAVIDANDGSYRYAGNDFIVGDSYKEKYNSAYDVIKYNSKNYKYYLDYAKDGEFYDNYALALRKAVEDKAIISNNIKNYVCFGYDKDDKCPHDNLYRIIGVFGNQLKLIKADYASAELLGEDGNFSSNSSPEELNYVEYLGNWDTLSVYEFDWDWDNESSTWPNLKLNTINLNTNFLNNIGKKWRGIISDYTWHTKSEVCDEIINMNAKSTYDYEVGKNSLASDLYKAKIGLMYVSDYAYAAIPNLWNDGVVNYYGGDNWLFLGGTDRFITTDVYGGNGAFALYDWGQVDVDYYYWWNIRPVFYLNNDVTYKTGDGSYENPIRINI